MLFLMVNHRQPNQGKQMSYKQAVDCHQLLIWLSLPYELAICGKLKRLLRIINFMKFAGKNW